MNCGKGVTLQAPNLALLTTPPHLFPPSRTLMKPLDQCRLYTFVDTAYLHGRDPVSLATQLILGGADLIQLRAKNLDPTTLAQLTLPLLQLCQNHGVHFVLNDHPEIALRLGAPLAHLGQEDFFDAGHSHLPTYLQSLNPNPTPHPLRIGLSSHAPYQAQRAVNAGAAYVAVGPVFATPTKPGRPPVTLDYVRWAAQHLPPTPWFAIGGITLDNLQSILDAGARRICVVSAILNAPDVTQACRTFRQRLDALPLPLPIHPDPSDPSR